MFLRMISRWTRSADLVAASRRNFWAAELIAWSPGANLPSNLNLKFQISNFQSPVPSAPDLPISSSLARQDACQMYCSRPVLAPSQDSLHVHQAAGIDGGNVLRAGHGNAIALGFTHSGR